MKTYQIYIKSHIDAPDFDIEMEAKDEADLVAKFNKKYDYELSKNDYQELI
uniref:Uncharacterized protein n=1 Tax=viral metagenome TaxID=1070528 RepID=A0A6M3J214_9ZZZZ